MSIYSLTTNGSPARSIQGLDLALSVWGFFQVHRKTRIAVLLLCFTTMCAFLNTGIAMASDEANSVMQGNDSRTYNLPLEGVTDSNGVPVAAYSQLMLNTGGFFDTNGSAAGFIAEMLWTGYGFLAFMIIALVNFTLSFVWLDWIASPFILIANTIDGILSDGQIIAFGFAVASIVIAIGVLKGRIGSAIVEGLVVAFIGALITTPIGNPSDFLAGDNGWVQSSADVGEEISGDISSGSNQSAVGTDPTSGPLTDIMLRTPFMMTSFGTDLDDHTGGNDGTTCGSSWNAIHTGDDRLSGADADEIRDSITGCLEGADYAVPEASAGTNGFIALFGIGLLGISLLIGSFVASIFAVVILALFGLLNLIVRAHLALFSPYHRFKFVAAALQFLGQVGLIAVMIIIFGVLLSAITGIINILPSQAHTMVSPVIGVISAFMIYVFFKAYKAMKEWANRAGHAAERLGLGKASQDKPSQLGTRAKQLGNTGQRVAGEAIRHQLRQRGTRALTKAVVSTGAAAATGGTSLIGQAGVTAGTMATQKAMARVTKPASQAKNTGTSQNAAKSSAVGPVRAGAIGASGSSRVPGIAAGQSAAPKPLEGRVINQDGSDAGAPGKSGSRPMVTQVPAGPVSRIEDRPDDAGPAATGGFGRVAADPSLHRAPELPEKAGAQAAASTSGGLSNQAATSQSESISAAATARPTGSAHTVPSESPAVPVRNPNVRSVQLPAGRFSSVRSSTGAKAVTVKPGAMTTPRTEAQTVARGWNVSSSAGAVGPAPSRKLIASTPRPAQPGAPRAAQPSTPPRTPGTPPVPAQAPASPPLRASQPLGGNGSYSPPRPVGTAHRSAEPLPKLSQDKVSIPAAQVKVTQAATPSKPAAPAPRPETPSPSPEPSPGPRPIKGGDPR